MSGLTVFGMSFVTVNWEKCGILVLICVNGISGILLIQMAILSNIWVAYIGYPIFRISYQVVMTIASFEIVRKIPTHAFGLIFGFNSFVALGCQTILTSIVNILLGMSPKSQFLVYGMYFLLISFGYILHQLHIVLLTQKKFIDECITLTEKKALLKNSNNSCD